MKDLIGKDLFVCFGSEFRSQLKIADSRATECFQRQEQLEKQLQSLFVCLFLWLIGVGLRTERDQLNKKLAEAKGEAKHVQEACVTRLHVFCDSRVLG